jgi:hypothetical protein
MNLKIIRIFKNIIEKEFNTPTGKFNLAFGIFLCLCFVGLEIFEEVKKFIWNLFFHVAPENEFYKLFYGLIVYGIACLMILHLSERNNKRM